MDDRVNKLIVALRDRNWKVRKKAIKALGRIGNAQAVELLLTVLLRDPTSPVKDAAKVALKRAGTVAVKPLISALQNREYYDIHETVALLLGPIRDTRAVEPLISDLEYPGHWAAAEALGEIGDTRAVDLLITKLREGFKPIERWCAAKALGKIGDGRAVVPLVTALHDEHWIVRKLAAEALMKIRGTLTTWKVSNKQLMEALTDALKYGNHPDVREAAAYVLGKIADAETSEPSNTDSGWDVAIAFMPIGLLITAMRDEQRHVRKAAKKALKKLRAANQPFLTSYRYMFCYYCGLRAERRTMRSSILRHEVWVACRGCGSSAHLLNGVEQVIGLIGWTSEDFKQEGSVVTVRMWNETDQTARNADIDRLVIRAGEVANYERAVNTVINALRGDVSRSAGWCKKIPVVLEGTPALSIGAMRMLEDTFGEVKAEK